MLGLGKKVGGQEGRDAGPVGDDEDSLARQWSRWRLPRKTIRFAAAT